MSPDPISLRHIQVRVADILADREVLHGLPVETLAALRHELRLLDADIEQALTLQLVHPVVDAGPEVLTTEVLAAQWGISEAKARELCRTGQIPARKLGRGWVVPVQQLRQALEVRVDVPAPPGHHRDPKVKPYTVRQGGTR